jgi:hypothetical protein
VQWAWGTEGIGGLQGKEMESVVPDKPREGTPCWARKRLKDGGGAGVSGGMIGVSGEDGHWGSARRIVGNCGRRGDVDGAVV